MKPLNPTEIKRLNRSWRRKEHGRLALLLDHVQGPFNIGQILRTAATLQVDHVYGLGMKMGWTDSKVQKTAMGTHRFLELATFEDAATATDAVKANGYRLVALELTANAQPLWAVDLASDVCIVVGNEDHGISPAVIDACDAIGYVPQLGKVGSMNVANAASVACYEARRQSFADQPISD
jgi:tRNA (guanosine-2'-O-)-methyltransferase